MSRILALCLAMTFAPNADARVADHVPSQLLIEQFRAPLGVAGREAKTMPPLALDLVKHFEGWSPTAYDDPVGYCTIGYGHLIALNRCEEIQLGDFAPEITEERGARLLESDSFGARLTLEELVLVDPTDDQFGALASFVFNVGRRNFAHSTLLELLNAGDYELAAAEFPRWVKAGGAVLPGLVARRECEQALFLGRLSRSANGRIDRSSCAPPSLGIAPQVGPLIDIDVGEP